jgi:hypothetical protein
MDLLYPGKTNDEKLFLQNLITSGIPARIGCSKNESLNIRMGELLTIIILTMAVGMGYGYGMIRITGLKADPGRN